MIADRFFREQDAWYDMASGSPVRFVIVPAGPRAEQIAWAEQCAMLARLRHPLLNVLLDYGAASSSTLFQAWEERAPLPLDAATATAAVLQMRRFLDAHAIPLTKGLAEYLLRPLKIVARAPRLSLIGVVLQPRAAASALAELLRAPPAAGVTTVSVVAEEGSGLRTLMREAARLARCEGYIPIAPVALARWPTLVPAVADRHVCALERSPLSAGERAATAKLWSALAWRSARPHVRIVFERPGQKTTGAIHLERMGTAAMMTMIYLDVEGGPRRGELLVALRRAEGLPGRLMERLGACSTAADASPPLVLHEAAAPYLAPPGVLPRDPPVETLRPGRIGAVLWRAAERAGSLEAAGRHAAAARVLARAAPVLRGRGEAVEAARCWRQLAWMHRRRGALAAAMAAAQRAAESDPSVAGSTAAALILAACRVDEGRLIEAEACLRNLAASSSCQQDEGVAAEVALGLARVLIDAGRSEEAAELVRPLGSSSSGARACEAAIVLARAQLHGAGDLPAAIDSARLAVARADALPPGRLRPRAYRVLAEALLTAGDRVAAHAAAAAALRAACAVRLPLAALRARALMLHAAAPADRTRLVGPLRRLLRGPVPARIRTAVAAAIDASASDQTALPTRVQDLPSLLEHFVDLTQRAEDDRAAVLTVLAALSSRLDAASAVVVSRERTVASAGRPWREPPTAAANALAAGIFVAPSGERQPAEAGEPVRCAGELIAAIGVRWIPGARPSAANAATAMRAASVAIAAHVRALQDDEPVGAPAAPWSDLLGDSAVAVRLREAVQRASRAPFPVLIEGESGSGKELVARAVHRLSARHARRFCAINCAALTDDLLEAELFGHTRGAFTGAVIERAGLFEEADGGTLFLDEVGELSARAQAKLLRVLQEGEVRRVGENLPRRVDVRVVAATNRPLAAEATAGRFRADLRFRLDVLHIAVPPLRERMGDIPLLAQHFWREACAKVGSHATLGPDALSALARYDWPGNVRELQNVVSWIAVHAPRRGRVGSATLPARLAISATATGTGTFEAAREEFERRYVRAALAQAGGHRQVAARALGMSRQGLAKMLRRLGLEA